MARKSLPPLDAKLEPDLEGLSKPSVGSGVWRRPFGVIKLILGICMLPFVYSSTVAFLAEFSRVQQPMQQAFWWGVKAFLILYLFVWEPAVIFSKGQKILGFIFNFFKPLVKIAPSVLPIYTLLLFALYSVAVLFTEDLVAYALFLFGFTLSLHLVFGAKSLRTSKADFLKANYIFGFSFVYFLNAILIALILNSMFNTFSFVEFINNSYQVAAGVFTTVFKQLFLR